MKDFPFRPAPAFERGGTLVRLLVAAVIGGFVRARHDQHRCAGDEAVKTRFDVIFFAAELGDGLFRFGPGDDDEVLPLREPRAGVAPGQVENALDGFLGDRFVRETPDHAAFVDEMGHFLCAPYETICAGLKLVMEPLG